MGGDRVCLLERAKSLSLAGAYEEALAIVNGILRAQPQDIEVLRLKGNIIELKVLNREVSSGVLYVQDTEFAAARHCYERILTLEPFNVMALVDLGSHWKNLGEYLKAQEFYGRATNLLKAGCYTLSWKDEMKEVLEGQIEISKHLGNDDEVKTLEHELQGIEINEPA
jgi:tetratricopeptide (TPR) repeat protein